MKRLAQLTEVAATAKRFIACVDTVAEKNEHKKVSTRLVIPSKSASPRHPRGPDCLTNTESVLAPEGERPPTRSNAWLFPFVSTDI